MSALVHVHGEFDPVRIDVADDMPGEAPVIWIRYRDTAVSLSLTDGQLAALESAAVRARALGVAA